MNRKQFLSQLLRRDNTVLADDGQECMICKEEFDARLPETETMERQIRLPCNLKHTVGSDCIAAWLQAHSTCPICRYEFFPAERTTKARPEFLYITFDDEEDISDESDDGEDGDFIDEGGDTDYEDENMSDEGEDSSDEDELEYTRYEKDREDKE